MNRTLTAAVALATALGMAGLAHAQSSAGPSTSPMTNSTAPTNEMTPPMNSPTQMGTQSPSTMPSRTTSPQANGPINQGQMNQAQTNPQGSPVGGQPASQSQIQQAQQQLKSQGLYNGSIDGVVGPETQTALSQFQRQNGLPPTAQLDQQTMDRLVSGGSNRATGASTYTPPAGTMNPATSGQTGLPGAQPSTAPATTR